MDTWDGRKEGEEGMNKIEIVPGNMYEPPTYSGDELAEIIENLECQGMCDENTQFEEWCIHDLDEYGYGTFRCEEGES